MFLNVHDNNNVNSINIFHSVVETYEASGKHTYPSMAVMSVMLLVLLLALAALYKNLAPKSVSYQTEASVQPVNPLYGHGMELTMSAGW